MRRFFGPVLTVALAVASLFGVAKADVLHDVMRSFAQQGDLRAAYAKATFDSIPSDLQAARPVSLPSHMQGLAFVVAAKSTQIPTSMGIDEVVPTALPSVTLAYDRVFTLDDSPDRYDIAPEVGTSSVDTTLPNLSAVVDVLPPVALSSDTIASQASFGFNDAPQQEAFDARLQDSAIAMPMPVRLGAFTLATAETQSDFTSLAAHDAQLTAGTIVDVRAGNRNLDISVGSNYERLTDANALTFSQSTPTDLTGYETTSALAQLPGGSPEMLIPNYADVTARGIQTGLAVPINARFTVGVGYGAQRFTGSYGTSFTPNLDANNTSYLGNITFALPRSSSAITLSATQSRYQDNLTPFSLQQTRADLNFTVKF